jgi:hypothetical protein
MNYELMTRGLSREWVLSQQPKANSQKPKAKSQQPTPITQFPHKVNEKKRDNDLSRQKNHFITKILCIFILKSDAMSIFFGYFADVNLYYQQHTTC